MLDTGIARIVWNVGAALPFTLLLVVVEILFPVSIGVGTDSRVTNVGIGFATMVGGAGCSRRCNNTLFDNRVDGRIGGCAVIHLSSLAEFLG